MQLQTDDVTRLLAEWRQGDHAALEQLWPLIRGELYRLAQRHLRRERHRFEVRPSSLVNEALVRLLPGPEVRFEDRVHFFALASRVMRHVLVDHARRRQRAKRGDEAVHIPIDATAVLAPEQLEQIVSLDLALQRLAQIDERKSKVFDMRFFGGLSVEEAAAALGVAPHTVTRDWNFARAWLQRELRGEALSRSGATGSS